MAVALDPDKWQLLEGQIFNWSWLTFQKFSSLSACRKCGDTQAGAGEELRVLHPDPQTAERNTGPDLSF